MKPSQAFAGQVVLTDLSWSGGNEKLLRLASYTSNRVHTKHSDFACSNPINATSSLRQNFGLQR